MIKALLITTITIGIPFVMGMLAAGTSTLGSFIIFGSTLSFYIFLGHLITEEN